MAAINRVFPTGFAMQQGSVINLLIDNVNNSTGNGTPTAGTFTTLAASGTLAVTGASTFTGAVTFSGGSTSTGASSTTITTVAAAGATQGTATAISAAARTVLITVTASTEGVKLPTAATGKTLTIWANTAVGCKVYGAAAGQSIGTATTQTTAYALVKNTATTFLAISTAKWLVQKGT